MKNNYQNLFTTLELLLSNNDVFESDIFKHSFYNRKKRDELLNSTQEPKQSATLLLLYLKNKEWHFALMQRPKYDGPHSNEICFSGGKQEDSDINLRQTALRETNEEFGINTSIINIVGQFKEVYIPTSNFLITPFLGIINKPFHFEPDPKEVQKIIEVPVLEFMDAKNLKNTPLNFVKSYNDNIPHFTLQQEIVWGATAIILDEFRELLKSSAYFN